MITRAITIALAIGFGTSAIAAPVQISTKDADIIVVRTADIWSGDESRMSIAVNSIKNKEYACSYFDDDKEKYMDLRKPLFGGFSKGIPLDVGKKAALYGFSSGFFDKYYFLVNKPVSVDPSDLIDLAKAQNALYEGSVIKRGNPKTLPTRIKIRHFFGNLAYLATTTVSIFKYGSSFGGTFATHTGLSDDAYNLVVSEARDAIVPIPIPQLNPSLYTSVDVRRLTYGDDTMGQILIAYKVPKTPEIETEALATGIVSAIGADTTPEAVLKAQEEDRAARQAIWDKCVAAGKCKK